MLARTVSQGVAVLAALGTAALVGLTPTASAATPVPLPVSAESWYRPLPLPVQPPPPPCVPLVTCVPPVSLPAASPYPAGTLHVGASGGAEEARTYVAFDTAALPFGVDVVGGTLVLPVLDDRAAGTVAPETATIQVCLATEPVTDGVDGAVGGAPAVDCAVSSKAAYTAARGTTPAAFTVDLKPFANALIAGSSGFAVLPLVEPGEAAVWHVAFARRDFEGGTPITAKLQLAGGEAPDAAPAPDFPVPVQQAPSGFNAAEPPAFDLGSSGGLSPTLPVAVDGEQPQAVAPAPEPVTAAPTRTVSGGGALVDSPLSLLGVFFLPILLAAAMAWSGRILTRDLVPAGT